MEFKKKLKEIRQKKGFTLRGFAIAIDIAPAYLSDIEKGYRPAPSEDVLTKMINVLALEGKERDEFLDLAANSKNTVASDISAYVQDNEAVRVALRRASNLNLNEKDWYRIIEEIEKEKDKK